MRSFYGACPLCSLGEHGSEHLAIWCPAVAAAWLHCLAAVGRPAALVTAHGHRPAAGDQEDASAEAAVALAKAVAEKCGVAASPDRAARLRPSLAALRDGGRGESLSGAELMYS